MRAGRGLKRTDLEQPDSEVVTRTRLLLRPGDRVLDYGCATGSVTLRLAKSVESIHGIDISSKMIGAAERNKELRGTGNATFAQMTIFDGALLPDSFDVVLAFAILHLLGDTEKVLARVNDLVRPGGLLLSVTPCIGEKGSAVGKALVLLARVLSGVRLVPRVRFFRIAELQQALVTAGFRVTEVKALAGTSVEYFVIAEKL